MEFLVLVLTSLLFKAISGYVNFIKFHPGFNIFIFDIIDEIYCILQIVNILSKNHKVVN